MKSNLHEMPYLFRMSQETTAEYNSEKYYKYHTMQKKHILKN